MIRIHLLTILVFLGNEKQKDGPASEFYYFPNYPLPKMADFGLAKLTAYSDNGNSPGPFSQGTRLYLPPVSIHSAMW